MRELLVIFALFLAGLSSCHAKRDAFDQCLDRVRAMVKHLPVPNELKVANKEIEKIRKAALKGNKADSEQENVFVREYFEQLKPRDQDYLESEAKEYLYDAKERLARFNCEQSIKESIVNVDQTADWTSFYSNAALVDRFIWSRSKLGEFNRYQRLALVIKERDWPKKSLALR